MDLTKRVNLERVSVLTLESGAFSTKVLTQILRGLGIRQIHSPPQLAEAKAIADNVPMGVIIVDPEFDKGKGLEFLRRLRRARASVNRFAPVLLVHGHSTSTAVELARDTGANIVVAKPYAPTVLLERILWLSQDPRPYVEDGSYVGPDRRFKEKPSPGGVDRRLPLDHPADDPARTEIDLN